MHYATLKTQYAQWLQTLGFSAHSVYGYPNMLHYFFNYLFDNGIFSIAHLNSTHVTNYFNYLQNRPNKRRNGALSTAHLNKSFDAIDKFLEFLQHHGSLNSPQPTQYRIIDTDSAQRIKVLTKQDITILYKGVENMFTHMSLNSIMPRRALATLLLDLCYGCGLRKSEAYYLQVTDVDLDKCMLFVRQAKGYKDRHVPMSAAITQRIKLFIYQYRKTFKANHNRLWPYSLVAMPDYFNLLRRDSGLQAPATLHTLRHSIATHLLQNGMSVEQIAKFLGHSTLDSTQVYTHLLQHNDN
ncbi:MAG: tyrosine-type recombinase/integrase [Bacteroidia bacterium]